MEHKPWMYLTSLFLFFFFKIDGICRRKSFKRYKEDTKSPSFSSQAPFQKATTKTTLFGISLWTTCAFATQWTYSLHTYTSTHTIDNMPYCFFIAFWFIYFQLTVDTEKWNCWIKNSNKISLDFVKLLLKKFRYLVFSSAW